jgi:hypothetical protein
MLKKSFVFMMLLAASLIGISSAIYHQPEVATAQPTAQPNTLGKRFISPQEAQQQSNVGTIVQMQQDKALVDRLFPHILQKIDGKTLAQKIDGGLLAQKIFPYLDIIPIVNVRYGANQEITSTAQCLPGEKVVGGGYQYGGPTSAIVYKTYPVQGGWISVYNSDIDNGKIISYVTCLSARIALKGVQEPATPPPVLR